MSGTRSERRALPLHLGPAAAALFDDLPEQVPAATADRALAALEHGRARLAELVPAGTELTVDAYRVRLAAGCPASAVGGGEFRWTPATAARHLGLRALALHLCGDKARPIEGAVEAVLAERTECGGRRSPGPWLASLDPPGRAVARAQAQRWAEQAVAWLPLRLVNRESLHFLDDDWWPGRIRAARPSGAPAGPTDERSRRRRASGDRTVVLHGRRDLTVDVGDRRVAITVAGGMARSPGAADADALTAVAATLCDPRGRLVRVVRVHPASGEVVATDVTGGLLDRGVTVALAAASALAGGPEGRATPGPGCTWCVRRDGCQPGTAWLGRPDRRSMGLPLS